MSEQGWKYSAYLKLYGKDGLQVSFTVNGDDADVFTAELGDFITRMTNEEEGFTITPEGIKPGEKLQEVDGWVLGETSEGQRCIHLFKSPLQWKVATVYEERIKDIPITINGKHFQWPGAAPEREAAERRGALNPCSFTIVLVPTGKTSDRGNPILKFDRVVGFSPAGGKQQGANKRPGDVQSYADLFGLLKDDSRKLAEWCRDKQRTEKNIAPQDRIAVLCEEINNVTGAVGSAEAVLEVLTGVDAVDVHSRVKNYVANGLIKWISPYVLDGKKTVENKDRKSSVVDAIKYIWEMADGYNKVANAAEEHERDTDPTPHYTDADIPF